MPHRLDMARPCRHSCIFTLVFPCPQPKRVSIYKYLQWLDAFQATLVAQCQALNDVHSGSWSRWANDLPNCLILVIDTGDRHCWFEITAEGVSKRAGNIVEPSSSFKRILEGFALSVSSLVQWGEAIAWSRSYPIEASFESSKLWCGNSFTSSRRNIFWLQACWEVMTGMTGRGKTQWAVSKLHHPPLTGAEAQAPNLQALASSRVGI